MPSEQVPASSWGRQGSGASCLSDECTLSHLRLKTDHNDQFLTPINSACSVHLPSGLRVFLLLVSWSWLLWADEHPLCIMNTVFPSEPLSLKIMAWFLFPHIEKKIDLFFVVKVFFLTQLLGFTSELGGPLPRQRLWRNSP